MLNAMRDGVKSKVIKFFLFSLLVLATGGMVFTDVGGFFRGGVGVNTVIKVGQDSISGPAFDRAVQRITSAQGMSSKQAYQMGLVDQIVHQEINNSLLKQAAIKNGIFVGDDQVALQINQMLAPALKGQAGVSRKDVLRRILQTQGMSEHELVSTIRQSMMSTILQSTIQTGASIIPRQEAVNLYRVQNETRTVEGFYLANASIKDLEDVNEDVLKALYEASKGTKYSIPETRSMTIATLSESNVKSSITIPDDDLKAEYERSIASFTSPEQRVIQQAVLSKEDDAVKVADAVKAGKSLKDAVKAVTGAVTAYNGEQTYTKSGLPKDFADVSFSASPDMPTTPVKTALGFHVLVVKKIIAPEKTPFEKVKADIQRDLIATKLSHKMQEVANTIDDRLASGEDLQKIIDDMNLKSETIGPVDNNGATTDKRDAFKAYAKDRAYIVKTAFEMNEGESAPVMQLSDGRYAALRVDSIKERSFIPYESARTEIKEGWINDQRASLNHERAIKIQQAIAGGSKDISAAAKEVGSSVQVIKDLKNNASAEKTITPDGLAAIFDAIKGETVMAPTSNGYLIATVKSINSPDPDKIKDADLKPLMDHLKRSQNEEFLLAYIQYLKDEMGAKVNRNLLDMMYGQEANAGL